MPDYDVSIMFCDKCKLKPLTSTYCKIAESDLFEHLARMRKLVSDDHCTAFGCKRILYTKIHYTYTDSDPTSSSLPCVSNDLGRVAIFETKDAAQDFIDHAEEKAVARCELRITYVERNRLRGITNAYQTNKSYND